jgi:hypothetical protein
VLIPMNKEEYQTIENKVTRQRKRINWVGCVGNVLKRWLEHYFANASLITCLVLSASASERNSKNQKKVSNEK